MTNGMVDVECAIQSADGASTSVKDFRSVEHRTIEIITEHKESQAKSDYHLIDSGLIQGSLNWLVLPGLPGCSPMYSPESVVDGFMRLVRLIRHIDPDSTIIACTGGRTSSYLATLAILLGVHVRVGMEDTVWKWPHKDDLIQSNVEVFKQVSGIAAALGRELMSADEYRQLMTLQA